ncbi:MAG: hypothetical protein LAO06_11195 [Acidobacteriia bacterium]|nr:hypothetical protein [Terriglobia bacterium]
MIWGMATGAIFMTVFGVVWMLWGIRLLRLPARLTLALSLAAIVVAASLLAAELTRWAQPSTAGEQIRWHNVRPRFLLIDLLQFAAISLAVSLCFRWRRRDLVPVAISLIVGVHFIPLAGLFGFSPYYAVAAAMILLNLCALMLHSPVREVTCCIGTGCILWLASIFVLLPS